MLNRKYLRVVLCIIISCLVEGEAWSYALKNGGKALETKLSNRKFLVLHRSTCSMFGGLFTLSKEIK